MPTLVETSSLQFLDVIASDRFVFGRKHRAIYEPKPIEVGADYPWQFDPTRSHARFVVLSVRAEGVSDVYGGPNYTWRQVIAQRLNEDDTYNPDGEVISIFISGKSRYRVIETVTLVGRMQLVLSRSE